MGATLGSLYTSSVVVLGGQHVFSVISALTHRRIARMVLTTTCNLFSDLYIPTVLHFTVISAFYSLFTFFFFFFKPEPVLLLTGNTSLLYEKQFTQKRKQGSIKKKKKKSSKSKFSLFPSLHLAFCKERGMERQVSEPPGSQKRFNPTLQPPMQNSERYSFPEEKSRTLGNTAFQWMDRVVLRSSYSG